MAPLLKKRLLLPEIARPRVILTLTKALPLSGLKNVNLYTLRTFLKTASLALKIVRKGSLILRTRKYEIDIVRATRFTRGASTYGRRSSMKSLRQSAVVFKQRILTSR
jgi:hypothetical protein